MKDPVCDKTFKLREAGAMAVYQGKAYYFCDDCCRDQFISDPEDFHNKVDAMKLTVGVMGSAGTDSDESTQNKLRRLGHEIARQGLVLITGACPGLPHESALGVRKNGGLSVGISPALSLDEHVNRYHSPTDAFDLLIYTGSGLMGREVTNIRSSDIVIIAGGRSGTLGEFAIAFDEGKLIGVLEGSGGITSQIPMLVEEIGKDTGASLVYESEPEKLLERALSEYSNQHFRHPSCFCD